MKAVQLLVGMAGVALPALAQSPAAQTLMHVSTSFDLVVDAPYASTAPLFGPEGERVWAGKHWNPEVIYPNSKVDAEGMVFTIQHGPMKAVWVNTLFDVDARHFQYVYFMPEVMVTVIDVRFKVISADATGVNVVYARTALTAEGNEQVAAMNEGDRNAGKDWQKALDDYLAESQTNSKPQ